MGLGGVISNLLSLGAQLIPFLAASPHAPSSSSSASAESHQIETELKQLMRMLERINATLYDAEEREIIDRAVKLWLKELRGVAYDAEDVLDEYRYEVLRPQVEARAASPSDSRKRKHVQVPDGMLDQIRQIRIRFAEIEKDRLALRLSDEDGPRRCNSDLQIAPTSHFVVESDIIGRENEKAEVIRLLSSENYDGKIISGLTIVGTGGIGKTTLAQLVYNDLKNRQKFDKFGWVCVSDDFNVQRLTREVVESLTGKPCDLANLSTLQKIIEEEIRGKSVFLVLDDMWNENRSQWESFQAPFMSASLVKILATTRNKHVAQVMQGLQTFNLGYMLEEQIWQLFLHYSFGESVPNTGSNLIKIGKQIVKKCGMLPLAVKSIACLLRHEPKEESWREILGSELWESDAANVIFPPLQISYAHLPTNLKPCFLYCSMFPRDYRYSAEELVVLWISHGYVQTNGSKNAEKIGWEYIKQLWQRSFFEGKYGEEKFHFTLHDMVHDLARFNSRHGCFSIEGDMVRNFPEELYHLYIREWTRIVEPPPGKFVSLRTFILDDNWFKTFRIAFIFLEAQKLRAVRLASYCVEPDFPWVTLKHLRYLSLHYWLLDRLPECICSLYNLQNMTLYYCPNIVELPKSIGNLISLEELKISYCHDLRALPMSFCQLKALRKLNLDLGSKFELPPDIKNLISLEVLRISNIKALPISFYQLKALQKLELECSTHKELPPDMENLVSLEELHISNYTDLRALPASFCQLKALRKLKLHLCSTLEELPPDMKNLISLEELTISYCENIKVLPVSLCQLKALRKLELKRCSKLEELPPNMGSLTNLQLLKIVDCNVSSLPPSLNKIIRMPKLKVRLCCRTLKWLDNFVDLEGVLVIVGLSKVHSLEDVHCENLASMHNLRCLIIDFHGIIHYFQDYCQNVNANVLLKFYIDDDNDDGDASSDIDHHRSLMVRLQPHPNLKELVIKNYLDLTFPDWIGNPTLCASLESIKLVNCKFITLLPFGSLDKLKYLEISRCACLQFIQAESLPLGLEEILIDCCERLISVTGIQRLKSLVKLGITDCRELRYLDHCVKTCIINVSGCLKLM